MERLKPGDEFPEFKVTTVDGQSLSIPSGLQSEFAIVLFYRAWW